MNQSLSPAPVNAPQPIRVSTDAEGRPVMVQIRTRQWAVNELCRQWVEPSPPPDRSRKYFLLRLHSGQLCCVFHAPEQGKWYRQRISQKHWSKADSTTPALATADFNAPADEGQRGARDRNPSAAADPWHSEKSAGQHWVTL
jgi:hypothetical protein